MKRGDIVIVAAPGSYGKPRPAVVVQSDAIDATESVLVAIVTSTLRDAPSFRLTVEASSSTGLQATSQVMIDKIVAMPRTKCGRIVGKLDPAAIGMLNALLAVVLGLAD